MVNLGPVLRYLEQPQSFGLWLPLSFRLTCVRVNLDRTLLADVPPPGRRSGFT